MPQLETMTVVLYDIPHDRSRTKVSDKCLDFGLVRFQYSAFHGRLTRNRREELALILEQLVEKNGGSICLIPVCVADCSGWINVYVEPPEPPAIDFPRLSVIGADNNHDDPAPFDAG